MVISQSDERKFKMAIVVKGEITITKGFDTWKAMVKKITNVWKRWGW